MDSKNILIVRYYYYYWKCRYFIEKVRNPVYYPLSESNSGEKRDVIWQWADNQNDNNILLEFFALRKIIVVLK